MPAFRGSEHTTTPTTGSPITASGSPGELCLRLRAETVNDTPARDLSRPALAQAALDAPVERSSSWALALAIFLIGWSMHQFPSPPRYLHISCH
eukprot:6209823-Pleurochrysis_carterae.AAC.1